MTYGALFSTKLVADGKYDEAVTRATQEIASDPAEPEARFNRAQALVGLGRLEEAIADYTHALSLDSSDSSLDPAQVDDELFDALRTLALAHKADRALALATLERYRAIVPEGRHVGDIAKWADHVNGIETVWYRDTAPQE